MVGFFATHNKEEDEKIFKIRESLQNFIFEFQIFQEVLKILKLSPASAAINSSFLPIYGKYQNSAGDS